MKKANTFVSAVIIFSFSTVLHALPSDLPDYGVSVQYDAASYGNYMSDGPNTVLNLNSSALSYIGSQTTSAPGSSGAVALTTNTNNSNIAIHVLSTANAIAGAQAWSEADIFVYDTFTVGGTGDKTFHYNLTLDGHASVTGPNGVDPHFLAYGYLGLAVNSVYDGQWGSLTSVNSCQDFPTGCGIIGQVFMSSADTGAGSQLSGDITVQGGASFKLGMFLWERTFVYNADQSSAIANASALFDAANTGYFTLTPVTDGASFTTASGLTYATAPSVPLPGSFVLFISGIFGLVSTRRFALIKHL